MAVTVVVGGQFGSEGKGKLVSHLVCESDGPTAVVRSGGSNAGHTAEGFGRRFLLRQLPSGAVAPDCELFLAAGMQIDVDVLLDEIRRVGVGASRLRIDPNASVISEGDRASERRADLNARLGSTLSGTGFALARKVQRDPSLKRARDIPELEPYLTDVAPALNSRVDRGHHVIVEGTQGFGLSLHHGNYPFVTGRDTTAASFLGECGLAPSLATDVLVAMRTYPIRVAGNSGPLHAELTWDDVAQRAGYPTALAEYTTVTGKLRRVGEFDWDLAERAVAANRPTALALHGIDYVSHDDLGATDWERLTPASKAFVEELEDRLGSYVRYVFTGPDGADVIDRGPAATRRGPDLAARERS